MKKGLVIGKFMPIHKGHMSLIDFAINNCDELIILVSGKKTDPIDLNLRYNWVKDLYSKNKNICVEYMENNLPNDKKFRDKDVLAWCEYIRNRFPDIDVFISSENYGNYLSNYMNINHLVFDIDRNTVPISGTEIRNNPTKYFDYLPDIVQKYFS